MPIIVDNNKSGIIVNKTTKYHKLGKYILFDDSIEHTGFNKSENDRFILIIDFVRPKNSMKGISKIKLPIGLNLNDVNIKFNKINKYYEILKI